MLMALHQSARPADPFRGRPSLRLLLGARDDRSRCWTCIAGGRVDLGRALLGRGGAAGDVVRGERRGAAGRRLRPGAGRQPRHRDQPGAGGRRGNDPVARRLPIGNLLNRAAGCVVASPCCTGSDLAGDVRAGRPGARGRRFPHRLQPDPGAAFLPAADALRRLLRHLLARPDQPRRSRRPLYLDHAAIEAPTVALGAAAREALRMADTLEACCKAPRRAATPDRRHLERTETTRRRAGHAQHRDQVRT